MVTGYIFTAFLIILGLAVMRLGSIHFNRCAIRVPRSDFRRIRSIVRWQRCDTKSYGQRAFGYWRVDRYLNCVAAMDTDGNWHPGWSRQQPKDICPCRAICSFQFLRHLNPASYHRWLRMVSNIPKCRRHAHNTTCDIITLDPTACICRFGTYFCLATKHFEAHVANRFEQALTLCSEN